VVLAIMVFAIVVTHWSPSKAGGLGASQLAVNLSMIDSLKLITVYLLPEEVKLQQKLQILSR